jgi:chromosome segregation ATPase
MSPSEYQDLVAFLGKKFDRIDVRFDGLEARVGGLEGRMEGLEGRMEGLEGRMEGLEGRLSGVEVGQESLRSDLSTVAELVTANARRIDRNLIAVETLTQKVEVNGVGIRAVRDRVAALEDHLRAV